MGPLLHNSNEPDDCDGRSLECAILFADLVSSSEFASVLGLREYAEYVDSFEAVCREQCQHFFEVFHAGAYRHGEHYEMKFLGDEVVVYMHTGRPANDVYQLLCLAISLKCGWLGTALNCNRIESGAPTAELAAGVHIGKVWARREGSGYLRRGFAINVAKRVETASRDGDHFRVYCSDAAFKRVSRRIRHIVFGPRRILSMKGVVMPIGVHEVLDSFVNPAERLAGRFLARFKEVAESALASNSFDSWIHSCLQVAEEASSGQVTDHSFNLCRHMLNIEPANAVALYYAAQALRERGEFATARLYLEDLTSYWPTFADGWLELGRLLKRAGECAPACRALLLARRHGVAIEEEELPVPPF